MESLQGYVYQARNLGNRVLSFLNTDGLFPQLILTVIIVLAIHTIVMMMESVVIGIQSYARLSTIITADTIRDSFMLDQSAMSTDGKLYPSNNELTGLEFSYSWHLYIDPENFTSSSASSGYRTVWYKGGEKPWPVLGPGVFLHPTENVIRIYMNAVNNAKDMYVDVMNIPVGKWFHVVVTQKGRNMDVYVNGNIVKRHEFQAVPRINFGNVYVFSQQTVDATTSTGDIAIQGPMKGMLSRLRYYAYAINFSQIDDLYRQGPSSKIVTTTMDHTPPYFHDSWWVTRY